MKWIILILLTVFLSGYFFIFGKRRQLKVTLINESGMIVERAVIKFFHLEAPAYRGDSIIVKNIAPQKSMEVLYNLEQVEGFSELSSKIGVEFREKPHKILENHFVTFGLRRVGADFSITIKSDTLIRGYSLK